MTEIVIGGVYRHFKRGTTYEIIGIARHTETDAAMVVYKGLYEEADIPYGQLWVRPIELFTQEVAHEGNMVPRFSPVDMKTDTK
jgi:hypothetical protein